jgi:hypothetical protein
MKPLLAGVVVAAVVNTTLFSPLALPIYFLLTN